ncbi:MAG: oligosaccharide flippase family protein, partial [Bdellovibrionales bacterium]|nr:oligosaccharide flippase family protein [Bdellovibrionales bacterium]
METNFLRTIFKNVSWSFFGRVGNLALVFFINVIIVKIMTKVDVGSYFYAMSIIWLLSLFVQAGVNHALVKIISTNNAQGEENLNINILAFSLLAALFSTTVLILINELFNQSVWFQSIIGNLKISDNFSGIIIWTFFFSLSLNNIEILKGNLKIKAASWLGLLSPISI